MDVSVVSPGAGLSCSLRGHRQAVTKDLMVLWCRQRGGRYVYEKVSESDNGKCHCRSGRRFSSL